MSRAVAPLQSWEYENSLAPPRINGPELASAKHPALETTYIRDAVAAVLGRHGYHTEPGHELSGPGDGGVARNHAGIDPHRASSYPEHRHPLFASGTRAI